METKELDIDNVVDAKVSKTPPGIYCPYDLRIKLREDYDYNNHVYDKKQVKTFRDRNSWLYYSDYKGWVSFFCYSGPSDGFGGAHFTLKVRQPDGGITEETIIGPWSSRPGVMLKEFGKSSVNVIGGAKYDNISRYVSQEFGEAILKKFGLDTEYEFDVLEHDDNERALVLWKKGEYMYRGKSRKAPDMKGGQPRQD